MKIVRRVRIILATVLGKSLLRCNLKIVQGEMYFVHKLCKTKCILFKRSGNLPSAPKPSTASLGNHSRLSDERKRSARHKKETPRPPFRVFGNDRLKATIFLCIKPLAQMELFASLFARRY
jgi:hypothetical protein